MTTMKRYEQQVRKVCDFIDTHLDENFTLDQLSGIAACSRYHFQRVFKSVIGLSPSQYILLLRMKRASFRLAFEPEYRITEIALEARFDSLEAFSRAFSRIFNCSPSRFRKSPEWQTWHSKFDFTPPKNGERNVEVNIIEFKEKEVACIEHRGDARLVYETAAKFIEWRKTSGLSPVKNSETYGVPYSDPEKTPDEEFRFDICGTHQGEVPANPYGVKAGVIPGGRCAVAIHQGSHDNIAETIYYLYQQWLPGSGETLRDYPCFFRYLNFVHEVNESELMTEVYLPIV